MNRAFVIGVVATPPTEREGVSRFQVGIPEEHRGRTWLQQVEVVARQGLLNATRELRTAQAVYVDGRLEHSARGQPLIEAARLFAIEDAPGPPNRAEVPGASHASPRPHSRVGHPRRIRRGTPQERVVWVRATQVGQPRVPRG
jgi:hypothetical protein